MDEEIDFATLKDTKKRKTEPEPIENIFRDRDRDIVWKLPSELRLPRKR